MEVLTQSAPETQELGRKLANHLARRNSANILCLYGDLGSGKTTFVQGLAQGLGIKKRILSPTFIMMRQYKIGDMQYVIRDKEKVVRESKNVSPITYHLSQFYHVDLYRMQNEKDVESLGLIGIWSDPTNIVAIEWPEKIEKILPARRINIYFDYVDEDERKIIFDRK